MDIFRNNHLGTVGVDVEDDKDGQRRRMSAPFVLFCT